MLEYYFQITGFIERYTVYKRIGIKFDESGVLFEYNKDGEIMCVIYFPNYKQMLEDDMEPTKELMLNYRKLIREWFLEGTEI